MNIVDEFVFVLDALNNPIIHLISQDPEEAIVLQIDFFSFGSDLSHSFIDFVDLIFNEIA
jgi:hypothetical protein